ncbi:TetR/AcrR family transcriptional regulator [Terrihabitans sp. B22-R8]|uniref:TetR/AcrR family transcriptional regulator n=1 Tax=Terrihabitans sp. B22-R8 TaxID=3425128 RepID=UPI00403C39C0
MAPGRPRSFDIDEALLKAMGVFWERGYEGASLAELTKAMGINPPSLYAAFGNKEELFRAALDRYSKKREGFMNEVLAAPTAREVIQRLLRGWAEVATSPDTPPGCLFVQSGSACSTAQDPVAQEIVSRRQFIENALRPRFEQARRDGDLPPEADPIALARYSAAMLQGMAILASNGGTYEDLLAVAELALNGVPQSSQPVRAKAEPALTGA